MPAPHDLDALQSQLCAIPAAESLLHEIAEHAAFQELTAGQPEPGTIALSLVATAALWKLPSVGIDALWARHHEARLQRRIAMLRDLQQLGYDRQAPLILKRWEDTLLERPKDDPMLKALFNLFGGK